MNSILNDRSLVCLSSDGNVICSSESGGIRPLFDCITKIKSHYFNCILHDKVVGLAAARLIIYSGSFIQVHTPVISKKAIELLTANGLNASYSSVAEMIMNRASDGQCPMEKKAEESADNALFYLHLKKLFEPAGIGQES